MGGGDFFTKTSQMSTEMEIMGQGGEVGVGGVGGTSRADERKKPIIAN